MYSEVPDVAVNQDEFESFALDRLKVLQAVETLRADELVSAHHRVGAGATPDKVKKREASDSVYRLRRSLLEDNKLRGRDEVSHFILRLAFCRTDEHRRWLLTQECNLFKMRFAGLTKAEVNAFFVENGMNFELNTDESLVDVLAATDRSVHRPVPLPHEREDFCVPFREALFLISTRRVFVRHGIAYVPRSELVHIVTSKFRAKLSHELAAIYRASQNRIQDERIKPIVASLSKRQVSDAYLRNASMGASGSLTPEMVPKLAETSFPLCMQTMQRALKRDSHMRYQGRRTYGLFLKAAGLSLEDSLRFWQRAFAAKHGADSFNKNYRYNIRHMYGKEGRRKSYSPLSCRTIINSQPGSGEYHGCPFRHFDETNLRSVLARNRVPAPSITELIKLVKEQHYQVACKRYWELMHEGGDSDDVGKHPNQYFDASVAYWEEKRAKEAEQSPAKNAANRPVVVVATPSPAAPRSQPASGAAASAAAAAASTDSGVAPMVLDED